MSYIFFWPWSLSDPNETSHCLASMFNTCRGSILFPANTQVELNGYMKASAPSVGCWILHCQVPPRDRPPLWSSREFSLSAASGINGGSEQRMKWILFLCFFFCFFLFFECEQSKMDRIQLECNVGSLRCVVLSLKLLCTHDGSSTAFI